MPKRVIISPRALNNIIECSRQVVFYTGYETSGIRLQESIFDKIESIGFMPEAVGRLREDSSREAFIRGYLLSMKKKIITY